MANVDRPNGFRFVKTLTGTPVSAMIRQYNVDSSNASAIFIGDAVTLDADGNVSKSATNASFLGVVVGVGVDNITHGPTGYYNAANLNQRYIPASTAGVVAVIPVEGNLFEIQSASDLDLAIGAPADIVPGTGNTTTGLSTTELTTSTNADVIVVEYNTSPDNDTTLANARYIVAFNDVEHATT